MALAPPPKRRLWTRQEYHYAAEVGIFRPDERLELLEGEVICKVSPQSSPHASAILLSAEALRLAFGSGFHIREEKPLVLSDLSEPEPDIVVVRGTIRETPNHPTPANAVLVMEVSISTLEFDRNEKATAYAQAGIAEYWLLNLPQRQLEVRRNPERTGEDGFHYRTLSVHTPEETISALSSPHSALLIADMFPTLPTG